MIGIFLNGGLKNVDLAFSRTSLFSLVLWVAICIFYNYLASYEEKLLGSQVWRELPNLSRQTGKWLPRIRLFIKT
jgi:hypothetical protein